MKKKLRGVIFSSRRKNNSAKPDSNHNVRYLNDTMCTLPDKVLIRIFTFLDSFDLIDCVYVSKCWKNIIDIEERWKKSFEWQNNNTIIINDSWGQVPPYRWKLKCTIRRRVLRMVSDGLCRKINECFLNGEFEYPINNWKKTEDLHRECLKVAKKWGYDTSNKVTEYWYLSQKMSYTGFVCGIYSEVSVNRFGNVKVFLDTGKGKMGIGDVSLSFVNEITYKMDQLTL